MQNVSRASYRGNQRGLVGKISFHKLDLVEDLIAESFSEWCDLCLVGLVTNSATDAIATILDALEGDLASNKARNASDSYEWFLSCVDHNFYI